MGGGAKACREQGVLFYCRSGSWVLTRTLSAVLLPQIKRRVKTPIQKHMPSTSEITLAKLHRDYEAAKAQIQMLGYVLPGTVQKRQYCCGKPNCRCVTKGLLHGPYYQWTRKITGKTVNLNLDNQSAKRVKEWIRNNRKLRNLCHQLEKTSLAVLRASTHMGKP
jgi:hypothetical protein